MKFCVSLISLLLCCSLIMAQNKCRTVCPAIFSPVCGEATVQGELVRCQFSNDCEMANNACIKRINWTQSSCKYTSPRCSSITQV